MSSPDKPDVDAQRFWKAVDDASEAVSSWPSWKRGVLEQPDSQRAQELAKAGAREREDTGD